MRSALRSSVSVKAVSVIGVLLLYDGEHLAGCDLPAHSHRELTDHAVVRRGDGVLHLHRLEHEHRVTGVNSLTLLDGEAYDDPGHRREQRAAGDLVGGIGE